MNKGIVGYIGIAIIGIGFIMMAASDASQSQAAPILKAILGIIFIILGIKRAVGELRK